MLDTEDRSPSRSATDALCQMLRDADRSQARAALLLASLAGSSTIEGECGLPTEFAIRLMARRPAWEARELAGVADALRAMPLTAAALERGHLSYAQVRAIVREMRGGGADASDAVDATVGRRAAALATSDPERIVAEASDQVARLRPGTALRREDRAIEASFLMLQPRIGGGGTLYGEADTECFATIACGIDAAAGRPAGAGDDPTVRGRQRIEGLRAMAESYLSGAAGGAMRPRPRLIAAVDLHQLQELGLSEAARVLWPLRGRAPRLTPVATQTLACDAEVALVLFDGARPIAVSDSISEVPDKVRIALVARDRGCRFPGCDAPAAWTDAHHVVPRPAGSNGVENLILLCRRCHRRVHRAGWRLRVEPDGTVRFRTRGRSFRSEPRYRPPPRE